MKARSAMLLLVAGLALMGCDSPEGSVSTARKQLTEFKTTPDNTKQEALEKTLATLDTQIAELEKKGDVVQADLFRRQADSIRADFQAARMARALNDAKNAIQGFGDAIKEAGKSFSETLSNASKETNAP
jgi:hypothetical protein